MSWRNQCGVKRLCSLHTLLGSGVAVKMRLGIAKKRGKRQIHDSTATLLAVPRYCDLLGDLDAEDETERGRMLVNSADGWRTEMAKWIGATREADKAERLEYDDDCADDAGARAAAWKPITLAKLFGGVVAANRKSTRLPAVEVDAEAALMAALADIEEDARLDAGAIEIDSDDEFIQ